MKKNTEQIIKTQLAKKTITSEMSKDYSLPDYQPEIKKLLKISANILPPKMDFGMDDAIFSGDIDYYVLYLGADNQMYCAPISDEYSVSVPLSGVENGDFLDGIVDILPENVLGRVTAPRKISIRARLRSECAVFSNVNTGELFSDSAYEDCIEKLGGSVTSARIMRTVSDTHTLTDEIILDARDGEVRVICADGRVMLSEVKGNNNELYLRGDAYVKILASKEATGEPYTIYRKLPIFASVPLDGASVDANFMSRGSIAELSVIVEEGRISLEVGVRFECVCIKNTTVSYTKDMYSTECQTRCEYKPFDVVSDVCGGLFNFTSGEARTLDELGIPGGSRFVDASGVSFIDTVECDDSRIKFAGKIKYSVIFENSGEYSQSEIEFPFSFVSENKSGCGGVFSTSEVVSTKGRIDGERISLDSEIALCYRAYKSEEISTLFSMHFGEGVDKGIKKTVVIFPSNDDSVWSIAKKKHIPTKKLIRSSSELSRRQDDFALDDKLALLSVHHIII